MQQSDIDFKDLFEKHYDIVYDRNTASGATAVRTAHGFIIGWSMLCQSYGDTQRMIDTLGLVRFHHLDSYLISEVLKTTARLIRDTLTWQLKVVEADMVLTRRHGKEVADSMLAGLKD